MPAINPQDLNNAKLDVDHMAALATSAAVTAVDRFGNTKKTWSGIEAELSADYAVTVTGQNRAASEVSKVAAASYVDQAVAAGRGRPSIAAALADAGIAVGSTFTAPLSDGSFQAYTKTSTTVATPFGAPTTTTTQHRVLEAEVFSAVGDARRVGLAGAPGAGNSAATSGTYVFAPVSAVDGFLRSVTLWAAAAGAIKVKRFTKAGDVFTFVGEVSINVPAAGLNVLTPADFGTFPVMAGELLGFFNPAVGVGPLRLASGAVDATSGWFSTTGDNTTNFTDSTISLVQQLQVGFDVSAIAKLTPAVKQLQTDVIANASQLAEASSAVAQVSEVGRFEDGVSGVALTTASWLLNKPAPGTGVIESFSVYGTAAGVVRRSIYSKAGDVFTLLRRTDFTIALGSQTVVDGGVINQGEYIGLSLPVGGGTIARLAKTVTPDFAWRSGSVDSASFTAATVNTSLALQMMFRLRVIADASPNKFPLTLRNSGRIGLSGDSLGAGYYNQTGKNWLSKVSLFSDWNFDNMAVSGDTAAGQLNKIRIGQIVYNDLAWANYGLSIGLIMLGVNDERTITLAQCIESLRKIIQTMRSLGAVPILCTEFLSAFSVYHQVAYRNLAEQEGVQFCDILPHARTMDYSPKFAPFFGTNTVAHPGVRTNHLIADPMERFLARLGRPRQSMKLFRKRSGVAVSTVADLMFDGNFERARLFTEIRTGHWSMTPATEKFYDELMPIANYTMTLVQSEYLKLMNAGSVTFDEFGLIDAIFDAVSKNIDRIELTLSDAAVEVYIPDALGTPYPADGLAVGTWRKMTAVGGKYTFSRADLLRAMKVDKLSILLRKAGGFTIAEPVIVMYGQRGKPETPVLVSQDHARGAELLAKTDCNTTTGWTLVGAPTAAVPADASLPRGATACITVNAVDKLRQTVNYAQDDRWDREVEVRVRCRRWVPIFASTGDYSTAPITADSFDWTRVTVEFIAGGNSMPVKAKVGLWWDDIVLRTVLPLGTTSMDIQVSAELDVQVALVSVKLVSP